MSFTFTNNFRQLALEKIKNYALSDDVWYTAYLVNGITHKKPNISRVIDVELINDQDSILSKRKLYTNDISVSGDFKIDKTKGIKIHSKTYSN